MCPFLKRQSTLVRGTPGRLIERNLDWLRLDEFRPGAPRPQFTMIGPPSRDFFGARTAAGTEKAPVRAPGTAERPGPRARFVMEQGPGISCPTYSSNLPYHREMAIIGFCSQSGAGEFLRPRERGVWRAGHSRTRVRQTRLGVRKELRRENVVGIHPLGNTFKKPAILPGPCRFRPFGWLDEMFCVVL